MLTMLPSVTQADVNGAFAVLALFGADHPASVRAKELQAALDAANERIAEAEKAEKATASRQAELARDTDAENKALNLRKIELDNIEAEQIKQDAALKKRKEALDAGRAELERGQKALEDAKTRFAIDQAAKEVVHRSRDEAIASREAEVQPALDRAAEAQAKADGLIASYNAKIAALNQAMGAKAGA